MTISIQVKHTCGHVDSHKLTGIAQSKVKKYQEQFAAMPCMICWYKYNHNAVDLNLAFSFHSYLLKQMIEVEQE